MEERLDASECRSMADVRCGVDAVDRSIVALLGERFRYMEAAARIKQHRGDVRDEARKAKVIANVTGLAERAGIPCDLVPALYEQLIEASIAYELDLFDELNRAPR